MLASLSTTPLASFLGSSAPPIPGGARSLPETFWTALPSRRRGTLNFPSSSAFSHNGIRDSANWFDGFLAGCVAAALRADR